MIIKNGNGFAAIARGWNPIQEVWVGEHYVWPEGIKGWLIDDFHRSYDIVYDGNPTLTPSDVTSTMPLNDIKNAFIAGKTQSIGNFAFMRAVNMTSLSIEGSDVTYIGRGAFMSATSLSSVSMTDNVLSIDGNAFDSCINLSGITLSESLQILGEEAFQYSGLRDITIPDTVETIGQGAFRNCTSLTGITLGSGVTSIPQEMLRGCTSLVSITIPSGVTSIGASALRYNTGMTGITMVSSTPPTLGANAFDSTANCPIFVPCNSVNLYKTNWSAYASRIQGYGCIPQAILTLTGGTIVEIPRNVPNPLTSGDVRSSVSDIADIRKIELTDWIWGLGDNALNGCTGLTEIVISREGSVIPIGENALDNTNNAPIVVDCADVELYQESWTAYADRIVSRNCDKYKAILKYKDGSSIYYRGVGSGYTPTVLGPADIADESLLDVDYYDPEKIVEARILPIVEEIADNCFRPAWNISAVTIPDTVERIGDGAFYGCALREVYIPSGVTEIGSSAFYGCALREVYIHSGVTEIGSSAFKGCNRLSGITFESLTPPSTGSSAFDDTNNCDLNVSCDAYYNYTDAWSSLSSRIKYTCVPKAIIFFPYGESQNIIIPEDGTSALTRAEIAAADPDSIAEYWGIQVAKTTTTIDDGACSGWTHLYYVEIRRSNPPTLVGDPFDVNASYTIGVWARQWVVDGYKEAWPQYAARIEGTFSEVP